MDNKEVWSLQFQNRPGYIEPNSKTKQSFLGFPSAWKLWATGVRHSLEIQSRNSDRMSSKHFANVADAGPTLKQRWSSVSRPPQKDTGDKAPSGASVGWLVRDRLPPISTFPPCSQHGPSHRTCPPRSRARTNHQANAGLMSAQRRRRWAGIKPALVHRIVIAEGRTRNHDESARITGDSISQSHSALLLLHKDKNGSNLVTANLESKQLLPLGLARQSTLLFQLGL